MFLATSCLWHPCSFPRDATVGKVHSSLPVDTKQCHVIMSVWRGNVLVYTSGELLLSSKHIFIKWRFISCALDVLTSPKWWFFHSTFSTFKFWCFIRLLFFFLMITGGFSWSYSFNSPHNTTQSNRSPHGLIMSILNVAFEFRKHYISEYNPAKARFCFVSLCIDAGQHHHIYLWEHGRCLSQTPDGSRSETDLPGHV